MTDDNQEIWDELTCKAYPAEKLPEVEYEYDDEDAVTDGILKSMKKLPKIILGGKTETDAQPASQPPSKATSSASPKGRASEKDWKKVEQKRKLFIIFLMDAFEDSCKWVNSSQVVSKRYALICEDELLYILKEMEHITMRLGYINQ